MFVHVPIAGEANDDPVPLIGAGVVAFAFSSCRRQEPTGIPRRLRSTPGRYVVDVDVDVVVVPSLAPVGVVTVDDVVEVVSPIRSQQRRRSRRRSASRRFRRRSRLEAISRLWRARREPMTWRPIRILGDSLWLRPWPDMAGGIGRGVRCAGSIMRRLTSSGERRVRHGTVKPLGPGFFAPMRRASRNRVSTTSTRTKATPHATRVVLTPGWKISS